MKLRPFIIRCAALVLILVFSQKTGAGLFLHNLLHTPAAAAKTPANPDENNREVSFACNCIDDFLMPFTEAGEPVYTPPVTAHGIPVVFFHDLIPFSSPDFSSLRGPPAFIL